MGQWLFILVFVFACDAEIAASDSGTDDGSTGVETDGELRECHAVVTRHLVTLDWGFTMTSLKQPQSELKSGAIGATF